MTSDSGHPVARLLILLVRVYQLTLSPFLGGRCRYAPSCSHYAIEAVRVHGAWRGSVLGAKRLCRCHPFAAYGYDPVPPSLHQTSLERSAR